MLINKIGDFFLVIAASYAFLYFKSVDFFVIFSLAHVYELVPVFIYDGYEFSIVDIICILLIFSIVTKSAQVGFHG
jgi:NADH:ubiquinone oxidoreductase subunit 5 (subunit L)/multisubunit Na+/H+ antiporter MnhA subunit